MSRDIAIKIGQIFKSRSCGEYEVIKIESYKKIKVRFLNTGYEVYAQGGQVTDGRIADKLHPSVYGIGILGQVEGKVRNRKSYKIWHAMLQRCYDPSAQKRSRNSSYVNVSVCSEWLLYSNFSEWFDKNYKQGYHLDKDLTILGNTIYSPTACCFVPKDINTLLLDARGNRGEYPLGVHLDTESGKFAAQINTSFEGKHNRKWLGYYRTPEEAFMVYKKAKEDWIKVVAQNYYSKGQINDTIYHNLIKYEISPF